MSESVRHTGTVKWFNSRKGYGFINLDDATSIALVHYTSIDSGNRYKELDTGDRVAFNIQESPDGPNAIDVTKI